MYRAIRAWLLTVVVVLALGYLGTVVVEVKAQDGSTTASITGVVTDEQGAAIGGATVTIINLSTNLKQEINSKDEGSYNFTQLPPGVYQITVKFEGFKTVNTRFELSLGTKAKIDLPMALGQVNDVVVVESNTGIQEGKTENSTNVDTGRIDGLPINRRNFLDFSLTTPRVVIDNIPQQGIIPTSGLSFNGQSARLNNITVDGVDNNDTTSGAVRTTFSQEAVQEFQVVSDSYSAEFGRALGGVVNIVTKGGTNDLHGRFFFLNRNDGISARNAFASFNPEFKQYQFGATLSGPIKKDKVLYFTSFERLSIKQNSIVTIGDQTVASARRLGFNLSNGPLPFSVGNTSALGRVDFQLSQSDRLNVRYNFGGSYNGSLEPFGGLVANTSSGVERVDDNTVSFNNTYINAGLNLINETRFVYNRRSRRLIEASSDTQVSVVAPEGQVTFGRNFFVPQADRLQKATQIIDNVSLSRGKNFIKFGVDAEFVNVSASLPFASTGQGVFPPINFSQLAGMPGLPTISGLALFDPSIRTVGEKAFLDFLGSSVLPQLIQGFPSTPLGNVSIPIAFIQGFGVGKTAISTTLFSAFAQDELKLRSNLLLKAGIRYDINRQDFTPDNNGNFSPRVSLAYSPRKNLVVRGGYGLFFGSLGAAYAFPAKLLNSNITSLLVVPFPFSVFPFALPNHRFPVSPTNTIPAGIPQIRQLSTELQLQPNLRNNYAQQATFGIEYLIAKDTTISAVYNYTRGIRVIANRNINPIIRPIADPVTNAVTGRVDPTRGDVFEFESGFDSYYNGFTLSLNSRLSKRFTFLANYTVSKAIDNAVDINFGVTGNNDPLRIDLERALSVQDVRNRFVASGVWDISYSKNPFLSGYQVSTIITLASGRPYNLLAGVDLNRNGDNPPFDRPLGIGRNAGIKPGFANVDLRVQKSFTFKERYRVEGFVEAFNLFNRTNISNINATFPPDQFGNFNLPSKDGSRFSAPPSRYIGAFDPRQLQIGFRFLF